MPKYLKELEAGVEKAIADYRAELEVLQKNCDHSVILRWEDSSYRAHRVCENCGLNESVQWDSSHNYEHQELLGRAYEVNYSEWINALPKYKG